MKIIFLFRGKRSWSSPPVIHKKGSSYWKSTVNVLKVHITATMKTLWTYVAMLIRISIAHKKINICKWQQTRSHNNISSIRAWDYCFAYFQKVIFSWFGLVLGKCMRNTFLVLHYLSVLDLDLISIASLGPRASTTVESHVNFTES